MNRLREEIVACRRCPRLVSFREEVARKKKREFRTETYWGRPVPGFGDPNGRLIVVGLAPAPHGGNRTGRIFTGDRSAAFLVRALYTAGFANQPTSRDRRDGLRYTDCFVTAAVRCAPPDNRPRPEERDECLPFLRREFLLLPRARSILALGAFAWDGLRAIVPEVYGGEKPRVPFAHGACAPLGPGRPILWGSYHPSPLNTNTGKLSQPMLVELLERIRDGWESERPARSREVRS
jgi:uracil-DNA glycosylase family 4